MNWGTFTYSQQPEAERLLTIICKSVCEVVRRHVPEAQRRALLLIGGYGRGEGGVQMTPHGPRPHNNLDFLLVTEGLSNKATIQLNAELNQKLDDVRRRFAIGIDLSAVTANRLNRSACRVMWYDMRHGHKTLMGDAEYTPNLSRFTVDRIPSWNVRDLLVNRGTLLLLNRWMMQLADSELESASEEQRADVRKKLDRIGIRHLIKAIIGYGDALLYFEGRYHWSYAEKLRRIQDCRLADDEFIEQYTKAAQFRFWPDYDALSGPNVARWQRHVTSLLAHVHLCCESRRLGRHLGHWDEYPEAASRALLTEQWRSPQAWARKLWFAKQDRNIRFPGSVAARWGLTTAGKRSRLSLAFPAVAYNLSQFSDWARCLMGAEESPPDLLTAYIRRWGQIGDTNFANFAHHVAKLIAEAKSHKPPLAPHRPLNLAAPEVVS